MAGQDRHGLRLISSHDVQAEPDKVTVTFSGDAVETLKSMVPDIEGAESAGAVVEFAVSFLYRALDYADDDGNVQVGDVLVPLSI
jgi:hypothetical protein